MEVHGALRLKVVKMLVSAETEDGVREIAEQTENGQRATSWRRPRAMGTSSRALGIKAEGDIQEGSSEGHFPTPTEVSSV